MLRRSAGDYRNGLKCYEAIDKLDQHTASMKLYNAKQVAQPICLARVRRVECCDLGSMVSGFGFRVWVWRVMMSLKIVPRVSKGSGCRLLHPSVELGLCLLKILDASAVAKRRQANHAAG